VENQESCVFLGLRFSMAFLGFSGGAVEFLLPFSLEEDRAGFPKDFSLSTVTLYSSSIRASLRQISPRLSG